MVDRMQEAHNEAQESCDALEIEATGAEANTASLLLQNEGPQRDTVTLQVVRWEGLESSNERVRRVTKSDGIELHPLWRLPTVLHATCAANWTFGRFLAYREAVSLYFGNAGYEALDAKLRTAFAETKWGQSELEAVTEALERMTAFWPWPLRHRRLRERMRTLNRTEW